MDFHRFPVPCGKFTILIASSASFDRPRLRRAIALLYQTKELIGLNPIAFSKLASASSFLPSSRRAIPFDVMARMLFGLASRISSKHLIASAYLPSSLSEYPLLARAKVYSGRWRERVQSTRSILRTGVSSGTCYPFSNHTVIRFGLIAIALS